MNSNGHVFIFSRSTTRTVPRLAPLQPNAARFDAIGDFVRENAQGAMTEHVSSNV